MKNAALLFGLVLWCGNIWGQTMEDKVRTLFNNSANIRWVEHFKGRLSDINDVALTLAYDGKQCKGIMWYLRSKAEFRVEGRLDNDTSLYLTEFDSTGNSTGTIQATLKNFDGIRGNWYNHDKTLGEQLDLIPTPREPRYPSYCGDNKWVRQYTGELNGQQIELVFRRANNGFLKGIAYFSKDKESYYLEGETSKNGHNLVLAIQDVNWDSKGEFLGKVDKLNDKIIFEWQTPDNQSFKGSFHLAKELSVGCIEYADYLTKTEITYPKTRYQAFNDKVNESIDTWLNSSRAYTQQFASQLPNLTSGQRLSLRTYCWYEIDFMSENLMSGKVIMTNTWDEDYQSFSFVFNGLTGQFLDLKDLFNPTSGYQAFIKGYIKSAMKKRPYYSSGPFEQWINTQNFEYFTLRYEGIDFSTNFNGIYGEQHVTIPYEMLLPYFKQKDNPIQPVLNRLGE